MFDLWKEKSYIQGYDSLFTFLFTIDGDRNEGITNNEYFDVYDTPKNIDTFCVSVLKKVEAIEFSICDIYNFRGNRCRYS